MSLKLEKILFPTDFTNESLAGLSVAGEMAVHHGAELHLVHGRVLHQIDKENEVAHRFEANMALVHERLESWFGEDSPAVIAREIRGVSAADVVMDYGKMIGVDLIVMSTHGRRGLSRFFLGSVAEEVLRRSSIPVLTVRASDEGPTPKGFRKILAPVDFSKESVNALNTAKVLAGLYNAEIYVVHVVEQGVVPSIYAMDRHPIEHLLPDLKAKSEAGIEDLLREARLVSAAVRVLDGVVVNEIDKLVEQEGIDLVIQATHGLTGLTRKIIGSVAEEAVRRLTCPVLTIRGHELLEELEAGADTRSAPNPY